MPDRDLIVECRQRPHKGRGRVAMHQYHVGFDFRQYFLKSEQGFGRDVEQRLLRRHDVEIKIGFDIEQPQHLIEHLSVLSRHRHDRFKFGVPFELEDHRRHFYCFGSRAEYRHHFQHCRASKLQCIICLLTRPLRDKTFNLLIPPAP